MAKKRNGLGKFLPDDFDYYVNNGDESACVYFTWCPDHKKYFLIKASEDGYGGSDMETPYCLFCGSHLHQGGNKSKGIPTKQSLEVVGWIDTDLRSKTLKLVLTESFIAAKEDLQEALETLYISHLFRKIAVIQVRLPFLRKRQRISLKRYGSMGILLHTTTLNKFLSIEKTSRKQVEVKSTDAKPIHCSPDILAFIQMGWHDHSHLKKVGEMSCLPLLSKSEQEFMRSSEGHYLDNMELTSTISTKRSKKKSQSLTSNYYQKPSLMSELKTTPKLSSTRDRFSSVAFLDLDDESGSQILMWDCEKTGEENLAEIAKWSGMFYQ